MRLLAVSQSRGKDVPAMRAERGKLKAKLLVAGARWPRNSGSQGQRGSKCGRPMGRGGSPWHRAQSHSTHGSHLNSPAGTFSSRTSDGAALRCTTGDESTTWESDTSLGLQLEG